MAADAKTTAMSQCPVCVEKIRAAAERLLAIYAEGSTAFNRSDVALVALAAAADQGKALADLAEGESAQ